MDYTNKDRQLVYRCVEINRGNIDEVIKQLVELRIKAASEPGFSGLIDICFREYECEADWESLETDEELKLRTNKVQREANNRRKEYEKLKLEFEPPAPNYRDTSNFDLPIWSDDKAIISGME